MLRQMQANMNNGNTENPTNDDDLKAKLHGDVDEMDEEVFEVLKQIMMKEGIDLNEIEAIQVSNMGKNEDMSNDAIKQAIFSSSGYETGTMPPLPLFMMIIASMVGVETLTNILVEKGILDEEEIIEVTQEVQKAIFTELLAGLFNS